MFTKSAALESEEIKVEAKSSIGIFWGTFDPPTLAHRNMMVAAIKQCNLAKLIVAINDNAKTKKTYKTPGNQRKKMLRSMLEAEYKNKMVVLCQTDFFDLSYAAVKKFFPESKLIALVGQDSFEAYKNYIKPYDQVLVVPRGDTHAQLAKDIALLGLTNVTILQIDKKYLNMSSTAVRAAVKNDSGIYLLESLAAPVKKQILAHGFFKMDLKGNEYVDKHYAAATKIQHMWRKKLG